MKLQDFVYHKNNICVITACLEIVAFSDALIEDNPKGFLEFYEAFRQRFGDKVKLYNTADMKVMKPIDQKVLEMIPFWFSGQTGVPQTNIGMEMLSGKTSQDAVTPAFKMYYDRTSDLRNSFFRMALPVDFIKSDSKDFLELAKTALQDFPLLSGYAGYSFLWQTRDIEMIREAARHYKPWLKRYPGFVHGETMEFSETALFGIVTTDWLVMLGQKYIQELKSAEKISEDLGSDITIHQLGKGIIIQAGSLPQFGDINRNDRIPIYQKVSNYLKKFRAPAEEAWIEGFTEEETEEWFSRYD